MFGDCWNNGSLGLAHQPNSSIAYERSALQHSQCYCAGITFLRRGCNPMVLHLARCRVAAKRAVPVASLDGKRHCRLIQRRGESDARIERSNNYSWDQYAQCDDLLVQQNRLLYEACVQVFLYTRPLTRQNREPIADRLKRIHVKGPEAAAPYFGSQLISWFQTTMRVIDALVVDALALAVGGRTFGSDLVGFLAVGRVGVTASVASSSRISRRRSRSA